MVFSYVGKSLFPLRNFKKGNACASGQKLHVNFDTDAMEVK